MKIASDINRRSMKPQTELAVPTRILDFLLTDWRNAACNPCHRLFHTTHYAFEMILIDHEFKILFFRHLFIRVLSMNPRRNIRFLILHTML